MIVAMHQTRAALRSFLESRRRAVMAELRAYPPRVTACDVQFNALLETRDRLCNALRRLDAMDGATPEALSALLDSAGLEADMRAALHALVGGSAPANSAAEGARGKIV